MDTKRYFAIVVHRKRDTRLAQDSLRFAVGQDGDFQPARHGKGLKPARDCGVLDIGRNKKDTQNLICGVAAPAVDPEDGTKTAAQKGRGFIRQGQKVWVLSKRVAELRRQADFMLPAFKPCGKDGAAKPRPGKPAQG
jgi:hypothetical protein